MISFNLFYLYIIIATYVYYKYAILLKSLILFRKFYTARCYYESYFSHFLFILLTFDVLVTWRLLQSTGFGNIFSLWMMKGWFKNGLWRSFPLTNVRLEKNAILENGRRWSLCDEVRYFSKDFPIKSVTGRNECCSRNLFCWIELL